MTTTAGSARARTTHDAGVQQAAGSPSGWTSLQLLDRSRDALLEACHASGAGERFGLAQLAALRAGTALLASFPGRRRSRPGDVWVQLCRECPGAAEWGEFFAACRARRDAAAGGRVRIGVREADDLVRQAEMFLEFVLARLGLPMQPPVTGGVAPLRRP